eukprot:10544063-Lingulodinium_polyedra.AAC.1
MDSPAVQDVRAAVVHWKVRLASLRRANSSVGEYLRQSARGVSYDLAIVELPGIQFDSCCRDRM